MNLEYAGIFALQIRTNLAFGSISVETWFIVSYRATKGNLSFFLMINGPWLFFHGSLNALWIFSVYALPKHLKWY